MFTIVPIRRRLATIGVAGSLTLLAACGGAGSSAEASAEPSITQSQESAQPSADSEAALLEQAKSEGEVIWYTTQSLDIADEIAAGFEDAYPGITVRVFRDTTSNVYQRFNQELESGATTADVFEQSDLIIAEALKQADRFVRYTPPNASNILEANQGIDVDGYYHVASTQNVIIGVNTDVVHQADAPRTWEDLLDAKYSGLIGTGHPGASGAVLTWAVSIFDNYGVDYFERLGSQDVLVGQSIRDTLPWIATGERGVVVSLDGYLADLVADGAPVELVYPEDGVVVLYNPIAITAAGQHPAAAKLFLNWMFSEEVSQIYVDFSLPPTVSGVEPPSYLPVDVQVLPRPNVGELESLSDQVVEEFRRIFGV